MKISPWLVALGILGACSEQPADDATARDSTRDTTAAADTVSGSGAVPIDTLSGLSPGPVDTPADAPQRDTIIAIVDPDDLSALGGRMIVPVQGVEPAQLRDTYTEPRSGHTHEALDIPAPRGTPVLAAVDGKLTKLHNSVAGGLMVYAGDGGDRFVFMYGHLDRYADGLQEGAALRRGQVIGYVGTTGNAPAGTPHLHFAVARGKPSVAWWKGTPVNPYTLFVPSGSSVKPLPSPPVKPAASASQRAIENRAAAAIAALKAHDMMALSNIAHPQKGIRFTPYTRVDAKVDRLFTKRQVRDLWTNKALFVWGSHDGTGSPIRLTFPEYYKAFVYDYDFSGAPRIAYDAEPMGTGNSVNNIRQAYAGAIVVEYHVPGLDPKYGGMDWRSLWLVFEKSGAEWLLTGVVHGSWTI